MPNIIKIMLAKPIAHSMFIIRNNQYSYDGNTIVIGGWSSLSE